MFPQLADAQVLRLGPKVQEISGLGNMKKETALPGFAEDVLLIWYHLINSPFRESQRGPGEFYTQWIVAPWSKSTNDHRWWCGCFLPRCPMINPQWRNMVYLNLGSTPPNSRNEWQNGDHPILNWNGRKWTAKLPPGCWTRLTGQVVGYGHDMTEHGHLKQWKINDEFPSSNHFLCGDSKPYHALP